MGTRACLAASRVGDVGSGGDGGLGYVGDLGDGAGSYVVALIIVLGLGLRLVGGLRMMGSLRAKVRVRGAGGYVRCRRTRSRADRKM